MVSKARNIGISVNAPEKECKNDKHCPFHGEISLRGRIIKCKVVHAKVPKNAIVEWNWTKKIPKYERYEKKRTRINVHNPACISAKEGDIVKIMETKKISKTKSFVIVEKIGQTGEKA
ncbi:30S ribosomal protein S17 [Candidatus Woesearchaeota archaeon]|nr:30S ribosomal protein S17 [Candidatus Woesearchaeota archaeon]